MTAKQVGVLVLFLFISMGIGMLYWDRKEAKPNVILSPIPESSKGEILGGQTAQENKEERVSVPVSILVIGVDGRKGDKHPRCDAIHILRFDPQKEIVKITTVPRGTPVLGEKGDNLKSAYIANVCHEKGIEYAISQITKITGIHPDYVIKIGFSQTLGLLRNLNLPTISVLQFLRKRSYAIGDYQRSRNQAVFLKDLILHQTRIAAKLPKPLKYLLYRTLDTDLDFEKGNALLTQLAESSIPDDPSRILLLTEPYLPDIIREIHFQTSTETEKQQKDEEFKSYQNDLTLYLKNLTARGETLMAKDNKTAVCSLVQTPFWQKLWLQIEDAQNRNQIHFGLLTLLVTGCPQDISPSSLILDFITEMEQIGESEKVKQGKELLERLSHEFRTP